MNRPLHSLTLLLVIAGLASGCATRKVCEHEQPHLDARLLPQLVVPEGVVVAPQVERLRIPEVDAERTPLIVREKDPGDGTERIRCLEDPPVLKPDSA